MFFLIYHYYNKYKFKIYINYLRIMNYINSNKYIQILYIKNK